MRQRQVLIFGDSHVQAMRRAGKIISPDGLRAGFSAKLLSRIKNGAQIGDVSLEAAVEMVSALAPDDLVASAIGGNQHSVFGLIQHSVPFDVFEPGDETATISEDARCIPQGILWDFFEGKLRESDGPRIVQLRRAARCAVCHIVPPPPKRDEAHILRHQETHFIEAGIREKGVSPAALRLKLWRLQLRVLRKLCEDWEVGLLPPPPEALCAEGFLKPEYYAGDSTHANQAYGRLVLLQLDSIAAGHVAVANGK
ncbi:MAG: hypothetical protein H7Y16_06270 [Candidatus Parcubacteria bacterium]|nr:hypothetical protein [Burkholderiales bacterium]